MAKTLAKRADFASVFLLPDFLDYSARISRASVPKFSLIICDPNELVKSLG